MHAEAMLLVDDREREVLERDVLLEQRMGADQEIDFAVGEPRECRRAPRRARVR